MSRTYEELISRARSSLEKISKKSSLNRLELPEPDLIWVGNKTILRNYADYPKVLRRESDKVLMYLAKELATAASIDGERAIFIGRKDKQSLVQLLQKYLTENVLCPVCRSPDTRHEKVNRLHFIVCEACGARSAVRAA
jgi:translation initiation factor 2 subunit 2